MAPTKVTKWTPDLIAKLRELKGQGYSIKDITSKIGSTYSTITTISSKLGIHYTKEQLSRITKNAKRSSADKYYEDLHTNWHLTHLPKIKNWRYKIGYLFGAIKGSGMCNCRATLHFATFDDKLRSFVADMLEEITGREINHTKSYKCGDKRYMISSYHKPLIEYLARLDHFLLNRYPRKPHHWGTGRSYSQLLHHIKKYYLLFPLDTPPRTDRRTEWIPKYWHRELKKGFLAGVWDARGKVKYNAVSRRASLHLSLTKPYIAELVALLHNRGTKHLTLGGGAYIHQRDGGRRFITSIMSSKSILKFAKTISFHHSRKAKDMKKVIKILKKSQK